jgi:SAM-dependent methyltransferase
MSKDRPNIFVVGTGRCGTSTMFQCMRRLEHYAVRHEAYPLIDITGPTVEIGSNIVPLIPHLQWKYPDAKWVHLVRDRSSCTLSWVMNAPEYVQNYTECFLRVKMGAEEASRFYYDTLVSMIGFMLPKAYVLRLENAYDQWDDCCKYMGVKGENLWNVKYNATGHRGRDVHAPIVNATEYAIDWWKNRHSKSYFPQMDEHRDWKIYDTMEPWFNRHMKPKITDECLEIGCGYGQRMIPLSRVTKSVDGIDIHETLLSKANELFDAHGAKNCSMTVLDGKSLPDKLYDLVYSISVFQHMPRATVRRYYQETARVLKPDGRAGFHFRAANGKGPYSNDITVNHHGDWSVGWTKDEIVAAGEAVGLKTEIIDLDTFYFVVHRKVPS